MSDLNDYIHEHLQAQALPQWEAPTRKAIIAFDTLWMDVTYQNWPQDDHWRTPLITQIDLYADAACAKLLVDGLELSSFTVDQGCVIEQNLDLHVQRGKR